MKNKILIDILIDTMGRALVCLWIFLFLIPVLFNFQTASLIGKIFMIIGSVLWLILFVLFCVAVMSLYKKSADKELPKKWKVVILIIIAVVSYVFLMLRYFDADIWGAYGYVITLAFLVAIFYGCYSFINNFRPFLNNEKITVIILSIAFFLLYIGGILLEENTDVSLLLIKIAVGVIYIFFISILLNVLLLNKKEAMTNFHLTVLAILLGIGLALLVLFPFYVQWWGLDGDNFDRFVTTYSAVVGGGLTLVGVAWTIKHSTREREIMEQKREDERKEEERKKYKPYFNLSLTTEFDIPVSNNNNIICSFDFFDNNSNEENNRKLLTYFNNSLNAILKIKGIFIDGKLFKAKLNNFILQGQRFCLFGSVSQKFDLLSSEIILLVSDILDNEYKYKLTVLYEPDRNKELYYIITNLKELTGDNNGYIGKAV